MACVINILHSSLTPLESSASDAPNCGLTYDQIDDASQGYGYNTFIVQASFPIITSDHNNRFIVQGTGVNIVKLFLIVIEAMEK
jgi:hypothetical protein